MNRMPAPTPVPIALMPSQSATFRSPGLPAWARRFSVRSLNELEVILATLPERRAASGRIVRSKNGCWSSSSWRSFAVIWPSWERRCLSGSSSRAPARPNAIRITDNAATAATMIPVSMALDLDVHDLLDEEEAGEHRHQGNPQEDHAHRDPDDRGRRDEHRIEKRRCRKVDEEGEEERQRTDDIAGQALLGGQGADLALDPDALADREGDRVQDLGKVAAALVLDRDRRGPELEVLGVHALAHV